jgi:trehalose 6-phosphate phosphatase
LKSLLSNAGEKAIAELPRDRTLYAFDFDGTIAPVVDDPFRARTLSPLRPLLKKLSREATVVVISGRARRDVSSRLHFPYHYVVGNHGLEGLPEFRLRGQRAKSTCRKWVRRLEQDLADLPKGHGIWVEDKGHSLSLHYRRAKSTARASAWLQDEIANLWPQPRVIGGLFIYNLVPKGSPHKGTALKALMKRFNCTHAVFVGDDITDEDAFATRGKILSVRVGRNKNSLAEFYLRDQTEMIEMLRWLLRRLE